MKDCVVVIPTYNERKNLSGLVSALLGMGFRCLIVDDNSPDGTGDLARMMSRGSLFVDSIHRKEKNGYGKACLEGFRWALQNTQANYIAQMDADGSHPPEKLPELLDAASGYGLVIGSRYIEGGGLDTSWPTWRKILSRFGNSYGRVLLGMEVKDITGGFRVWDRLCLQHLLKSPIESSGYCFQVETAYLATKVLLWAYKEVPFHFRERAVGKSKMSLKIQLEAAWRVLQLRRLYAK